MGRPASSFIGEGKARVIEEKKEKNEREKGLGETELVASKSGKTEPAALGSGETF